MGLSGIYKIQSKIKPDRVYIGSSISIHKRWSQHMQTLKAGKHRSVKLQRHYNKYGETDLQFSVLLGCDNNKGYLLKTEQFFLDSYNPYFNSCPIAKSRLGTKASEETRRKLRESHLGKSNPHKGHKHSEETKIKIGNASRHNKYALGHRHTEEAKKKISEAIKGSVRSDETKLKISKAHTGKVISIETRKRLSEIRKSQKGLKRGKYKLKIA